jgi:2-polyprenyl-3-methyl-5-hydroxy-6-metoxy-1,4-benzoquinol methylase
MRERLRPAYTPEHLASLYEPGYDHTIWRDHRARVQSTIEFVLANVEDITSIADLSAGDGAIPLTVAQQTGVTDVRLGDMSPAWIDYQHHGPLEDTLKELEPVDLYVCSETLEHLDDPDTVLARIRSTAKRLIISTPCDETLENQEHYWRWSASDVCKMLEDAGWQPYAYTFLEYQAYDIRYQLWAAR